LAVSRPFYGEEEINVGIDIPWRIGKKMEAEVPSKIRVLQVRMRYYELSADVVYLQYDLSSLSIYNEIY